MSEVIKCRPSTSQVQALKTYPGQSLYDIRDFMVGSKNVHFHLSELPLGVSREFTGPLAMEGGPILHPGDYIVKDNKGYTAFFKPDEFDNLYEVDKETSIEQGLVHALHKIYGFSVEQAIKAVKDDTIRDFLLVSLKAEAESNLKELKVETHFNYAEDSGIDSIKQDLEKAIRLLKRTH